ncbi:peptidase [Streptomyces sp. NPDC093546]|uniref:peptidase n=1 Tax=Streptomyces sp. NPDC093546 TaxID=3366040 RepID=UPI0037F27A1A
MTTPVVMLSVTPAYADTKPTASQPQDSKAAQAAKPSNASIKELEKAAAEARKAYDAAVVAEKAAYAALEAALSDTAPHTVAAKAAAKEAADAAAAQTAADEALAAAKAKQQALPADATDEEKAAAQKAVDDAEAAAKAAAEAKTAADTKAADAGKAESDAHVAAFRAYGQAQKATADALKAKEAADKALADAKAEEGDEGDEGDDEDLGDCVPEPKLTTVVTGLPSKVVAGTTVNFTLRVTNGTDKTMDEVDPLLGVHATDKADFESIDDLLRLQWSSATSPAWKTVDGFDVLDTISPLKAGAHADIKLRLTVDAKAPAGDGIALAAGDYYNDDTCGFTPELEEYPFTIAPAGTKPGKVDDAKPGGTTPRTPATTPQGVTSTQPVNATTGSLAATGSSSAVPQIALAGGVAVALGAGAMIIVRRRKADANG